MTPLRVGMIGLDSSKVVRWTRMLHDATDPDHVPGGRVVAGYPGGSEDFPLSRDRVGPCSEQLRDSFGVRLVDSPAAVAEASDIVLITACDGRSHRQLFEQTLTAPRPTFIDKPLATSLLDARMIFRAAEQHGVPVMACSPKRYHPVFLEARTNWQDDIAGMEVYGPMAIQLPLEGLFWYGVHGMDLLVALLGPNCLQVQGVSTDHADALILRWADDRIGCYRGLRGPHKHFGLLLHTSRGPQWINMEQPTARSNHAFLLEHLLHSLSQGRSAVPASEALSVVAMVEAANRARATFSAPITIDCEYTIDESAR